MDDYEKILKIWKFLKIVKIVIFFFFPMNQDVPVLKGTTKLQNLVFFKLSPEILPGFSEADLLHSFSGHFQWHVSFFLHASKGRVFGMSQGANRRILAIFLVTCVPQNTFLGHIVDIC